MKVYGGSGYIDSHFLDFVTRWRLVVSFTPQLLYPQWKSPWYPLDRRLGGPQSQSGRCGEEKILDPTGTQTPTPRLSSPVASRCTVYATSDPEWSKLICKYTIMVSKERRKTLCHSGDKMWLWGYDSPTNLPPSVETGWGIHAGMSKFLKNLG
jgi:hypothetical protein